MSYAADMRSRLGDDLYNLSLDTAAWSQETFGSDLERGPIGPLKHLEMEAREAQASPHDRTEYADCFLLILDASRRAGMTVAELIRAAHAKLQINKARVYLKPIDPNVSVEHVRSRSPLKQDSTKPRSGAMSGR